MAISSQAEEGPCSCGKAATLRRTRFGKNLCRHCYNVAAYRESRDNGSYDKRLAKQREQYRTDPELRDRMRANSIKINREWWRRKRNQLLSLKGHKCVRCGFSDIRALQLDHINGGGVRQQRTMNRAQQFEWFFANPDKWQILCANCNWIKKTERNEQPPGPPRRY